jgi:adenine-specific DNA-methyltransferase
MRVIKDQKLTSAARVLRKTQTLWESRLWYFLRGRRFKGFKFRRQYPIGRYITDFVCLQKKLIVELDGSGHNTLGSKARDCARDDYMRKEGFVVLRFWNSELDNNLEGVLNTIYQSLK